MSGIGAALAKLDLALEANPLDEAALKARAKIMLQLDNPHEIAHAARMLVHFPDRRARVLLDHCLVRLLNMADPPRNINIGGGANFHHAHWRNFDSAQGPLNPWPVWFDAKMVFPVADRYARLVYSSHCLEHLDDATVAQVLREAHRMLREDGALVLKLPDFEQVLERWRAGDEAYFDQWGLQDVIPTWRNMGVEPTIDAKAAMIFCGWWNDAYGDEFGRRTPDAPGAYHGPAELVPLNTTPHDIAAQLRKFVRFSFPAAHFNHQNAWSRAELRALLEAHGFAVLSMDAEAICAQYAEIPGIRDQRAISMYALAA